MSLGVWIAFGMAAGIMFWLLTDEGAFLLFGPSVGLALGVLVGATSDDEVS